MDPEGWEIYRLPARAQPLGGRGSGPPKFGWTTPTFYVAALCSARNWLYHPYFVLYNNLDQGIGPPTLKTWLRPCLPGAVLREYHFSVLYLAPFQTIF